MPRPPLFECDASVGGRRLTVCETTTPHGVPALAAQVADGRAILDQADVVELHDQLGEWLREVGAVGAR
jgi:hypothetical protein